MKRLLVLPFVVVLGILTVGSVGQVADREILLNISKLANGSYFFDG